jgi:hypothetical protein
MFIFEVFYGLIFPLRRLLFECIYLRLELGVLGKLLRSGETEMGYKFK